MQFALKCIFDSWNLILFGKFKLDLNATLNTCLLIKKLQSHLKRINQRTDKTTIKHMVLLLYLLFCSVRYILGCSYFKRFWKCSIVVWGY